MLVLSRRINEAVVIEDSGTVRVVGVRRGKVKLEAETQARDKGGGPPVGVLTRRINESISLPGDVSICVVDIQPGKVRLGITAPPNVLVHREEVRDFNRWQTREARLNPRRQQKVRVIPLRAAVRDGKSFLNAGQYLHLTDIVRRLADWCNRDEISDLRIAAVHGLWELKEKGGILGRINARVFFAYLSARREIVVLGAIKKEQEDQTPKHIVIRMENRLRAYLEGLAR